MAFYQVIQMIGASGDALRGHEHSLVGMHDFVGHLAPHVGKGVDGKSRPCHLTGWHTMEADHLADAIGRRTESGTRW